MSARPRRGGPIRFDLSLMVGRSVATLYSHLVTRPTGEALRLGIESQIGELGDLCISILDFSQVAVIDFSCAEETVAKLIRRFQADDRPNEAYFIARGLGEYHRETVEIVLARQGLALVAETEDEGLELLGEAESAERQAWDALGRMGRARPDQLDAEVEAPGDALRAALEGLTWKRVAIYDSRTGEYVSLASLLEDDSGA